MNKKYIIAVVVAVVVIATGAFIALSAYGDFNFSIGGDEFSENMREMVTITDEILTVQDELAPIVNDQSNKGLNKKEDLLNQYLDLQTKQKTCLNKALESTNNETMKKYINLLIEQNQREISQRKDDLSLIKAVKEFNDEKISIDEYNNELNKYDEKYDKYIKESKNICKEIKDLLKGNPEFLEELKSYGITGIYIGDFSISE